MKTLESYEFGQEVAKPIQRKSSTSFGKADTRYWEKRLIHATYSKDGNRFEGRDWCVRIRFRGRRELFNLGSPNKAAASVKAREIYLSLQSNGWQATASRYKGKSEGPGKIVDCTLGEFFTAIKETSGLKAKTLADYGKALRLIVAESHGITAGKEKYSPRKGLGSAWADRVNAVKLSSLTPEKVQRWKLGFLKRRGQSPTEQRAAKISLNSLMRQAKTLFSKKHTRFLNLTLPSPLPFHGVEFLPRESMRYHSSMNAEQLVKDAMAELGGGTPEQQEQFKVLVLAVMAGLRRNEIDKLEWTAFDFANSTLTIKPTAVFDAKSEDSIAQVDLDEEITSLFRGFRARGEGAFVIQSREVLRCAKRLDQKDRRIRDDDPDDEEAIWSGV